MLHIFTAGKRTDANGVVVDFDEATLSQIAATYDPSLHEAPFTIGHPKHDAPAYGWAASVSASGDRLMAEPRQVEAAFSEAVQAGRYKKISASFYLPGSAHHPIPDSKVPYLRHVGFLGAMPPAVKGMGAIEFEEGEEGVFFAEFEIKEEPMATELEAREAALVERERKLAVAEAANFCECLINEGRGGIAGIKAQAIAILSGHSGSETAVEFAEGQSATPRQMLEEILKAFPKDVVFGEVAKPADDVPPEESMDTMTMAKKARALMAKKKAEGEELDYAEAVRMVAEKAGVKG